MQKAMIHLFVYAMKIRKNTVQIVLEIDTVSGKKMMGRDV